jgi:hypothetical protein
VGVERYVLGHNMCSWNDVTYYKCVFGFTFCFLGYFLVIECIYIYMRGKAALLVSEFLGIFCIKFPKNDRGVRAPPLGPFLATYQSEKKEKTKKNFSTI